MADSRTPSPRATAGNHLCSCPCGHLATRSKVSIPWRARSPPRCVRRQQRWPQSRPLSRIAEKLKNRGPGTPAARGARVYTAGCCRRCPSSRPHRAWPADATSWARAGGRCMAPPPPRVRSTRPLPSSNRRVATRVPPCPRWPALSPHTLSSSCLPFPRILERPRHHHHTHLSLVTHPPLSLAPSPPPTSFPSLFKSASSSRELHIHSQANTEKLASVRLDQSQPNQQASK